MFLGKELFPFTPGAANLLKFLRQPIKNNGFFLGQTKKEYKNTIYSFA